MAVKNTTIFVNTIIYQLHVSAKFGHLKVGIQCQRKNYLSDLNAGVLGRGRDLVYKYGVSGRNGVGTSVCPLGEFICWSVSPAHLHLDQTDHFSSDTVFQPEDGRIRPKHVVGELLYLQI